MPPCSISVVTPVYNGARFIADAVRSVWAQTRPAHEIIVVDDASSNDTCTVVQALIPDSPVPLRLLRMPTNSGGASRPADHGARHVGGECFTVLDHDDLLVPEALAAWAAAYEEAASDQLGLVTSDFTLFSEAETVFPSFFRRSPPMQRLLAEDVEGRGLHLAPAAARRVLSEDWCLPFKGLIPRRVWAGLGGFDVRYRSAYDCDFVWRIAQRCTIRVLNRVLLRVRQHPGSLSSDGALGARELVQVYRAVLPDLADAGERRSIRAKMKRELQDLSYHCFKQRRFLALGQAYGRLVLTKLSGIVDARRGE